MDDREKSFKDKVRAMGEVGARHFLKNAGNSFHVNKEKWTLDVIQEFEDERINRGDAANDKQMRIARSAKNAAWVAAVAAIIATIVAIIPFFRKG